MAKANYVVSIVSENNKLIPNSTSFAVDYASPVIMSLAYNYFYNISYYIKISIPKVVIKTKANKSILVDIIKLEVFKHNEPDATFLGSIALGTHRNFTMSLPLGEFTFKFKQTMPIAPELLISYIQNA